MYQGNAARIQLQSNPIGSTSRSYGYCLSIQVNLRIKRQHVVFVEAPYNPPHVRVRCRHQSGRRTSPELGVFHEIHPVILYKKEQLQNKVVLRSRESHGNTTYIHSGYRYKLGRGTMHVNSEFVHIGAV